MHFVVKRIRLELNGSGAGALIPGRETNAMRGALGAAIRSKFCDTGCKSPEQCPRNRDCFYAKFFDPRWESGPSGYRSAPRPFVLRWNREGLCAFDMHLFEIDPPMNQILGALKSACDSLKLELRGICELPALCLPVEGAGESGHLRLAFATPTELKEGSTVLAKPEFRTVARRLCERVQALGVRYQNWPDDLKLDELLDDAGYVQLLESEWAREEVIRRSARSGRVHSIGGFTGWAEYEGPAGRMLPLLEIGRWTGVGRQTVWGKGEIRVVRFTPNEQP